MTNVLSTINISYAIVSHVSVNPYGRLFSEIVAYLEEQTLAGGEFEGFFVYSNPPANKTLHFPCVVVSMERGGMGYLFGGEYDEGGTLTMKIMFTHKHVVTMDVL